MGGVTSVSLTTSPQDSVPPQNTHLEGLQDRGTFLPTEGSSGKHYWGVHSCIPATRRTGGGAGFPSLLSSDQGLQVSRVACGRLSALVAGVRA